MEQPAANLRLDHIYMPAKKPEWLAEWYAEMLGLPIQGGLVISGGMVLVFQPGEPAHRSGQPQFGFRCESRQALEELATKLNAEITAEALYCSFEASDPEGYRFRVYWEGQS